MREKLEKKCNFVSEKRDFCQKMQKSAISAQKCEKIDFCQIVHNNAILLKQCDFCPKVRDHTLALFQMPCRSDEDH